MSDVIGKVMSSAPNNIVVIIDTLEILERYKTELQIGKYLSIADGNNNFIVSMINNIKLTNYDVQEDLKVIIETQPIGIYEEDNFTRGANNLPVPTEPVYILENEKLERIYGQHSSYNFEIGRLSQNRDVNVNVNGDLFFGKHLAIVGSTGSGKSNTVAKILQDIVGIKNAQNMHMGAQRNSHIIIFDIHAEYESAFNLEEAQNFNLNKLSVENLKLPYWLMNSEELEYLFIESNDSNSYNQISMFKNAVIKNKMMHNPNLKDVTYDTPVYFNINEVFNFIENMNREVIGKLEGENCPKLSDGTLITERELYYFTKIYEFVQPSTSRDSRASVGAFSGEFNRFLSRLETKLKDRRLEFILNPIREDGTNIGTDDFEEIIKQFLGYLNKSNITIVDLSNVPFEVLSICVSLISRLIFDFCFHYSKIQHSKDLLNDIPVMLVCEEAHNYLPRSGGVQYNASKKSLEKIAKEGRKYGLSLMVVSQRPSEVSETIFAQCNNFLSLRLTNNNDQNYIKTLMPEGSKSLGELLPNLTMGECVIVGEAIILPSIVKISKPNPEPKSQSICFNQEWTALWRDVDFNVVVKKWRKEIGIEDEVIKEEVKA